MSFSQFPNQAQAIEILQRSLQAGRLAHAYLFSGNALEELKAVARTLAKTVNCEAPPSKGATALPIDCCDKCSSCRRIDAEGHPDIRWIRPESKSRIISIDQMRELMQTVYLKPTEARYKVAILCGVDRLNSEGANAFLKTLEEPPANSIFILLTTDAHKIIETILSRCLRLTFASNETDLDEPTRGWLRQFSETASADPAGLLNRYRLLDVLLQRLAQLHDQIESELTARSPLEKYSDAEAKTKEKWEVELAAAIEAEYRKQRADLLGLLQTWFRDIWIMTATGSEDLLMNPEIKSSTISVARRIQPTAARENLDVLERLQRLFNTNVQESLSLEVSLLKLKL